MQTGFFTAAATEYYTQPQTLNAQGQIKGHQHVTIQRLASTTNAPDASVKDFFKGVNDAAPADGTLVVAVPARTLTTPGTYRICTISGSFSHQPVVMPIAQRGAQDDCIRVTVGAANGGGGNNGGNRGNRGGRGRGRRFVKRYSEIGEELEDDQEGMEDEGEDLEGDQSEDTEDDEEDVTL
jgi:transcription initiation factor TFIID subunit 15